MKRFFWALAALFALTPAVNADITGFFLPVTTEAGLNPPAGFRTSDLSVTSTTDWLAANLIIDLSGGSFFQSPFVAGFGPPSSALFPIVPETRWDTYVTGKGGLAGGSPASAGGAVDLGGSPGSVFNGTDVNLNWFTTTTNDTGTFTIGRFTISSDATGTFQLRLDAAGQNAPFLLRGTIQGGEFAVVPEVSTVWLVGGAGILGLLVRRRLKSSV